VYWPAESAYSSTVLIEMGVNRFLTCTTRVLPARARGATRKGFLASGARRGEFGLSIRKYPPGVPLPPNFTMVEEAGQSGTAADYLSNELYERILKGKHSACFPSIHVHLF